MSIDISLLQLIKHRTEFERLHRVINARVLDPKTKVIVNDFKEYFAQVEECERIPLTGEFFTWFSMVRHRTLSSEDLDVYRRIFTEAERDPDQMSREMLVQKLLEADLALGAADLLAAYDAEEEVDVPTRLRKMLDDFENHGKRTLNLPIVEADESLFDDDVNDTGFRWRWGCLNLSMRPLRPGDFGILAGRPDKGKTTALTDNVTYMAGQLPNVYPDEDDRCIMWLNNEGPGDRILKRCIQSALGLPTSKLVEMQKKGKLWDAYDKALGVSRHRIKVLNIHGYRAWQVEEILRQIKPGLVVFDMIDNVNFDGSIINGGQRQDSILEGMYQWARELGVRFHCPIIATSQISFDGDGVPYPTLPMLKDSKTGKQGAADFIITIGTRNEEAYEELRFIGMTKNKLHQEGQSKSPRQQLIFDGPSGRYLEGK